MKLKNMTLFSSALLAFAPMGVAVAEEINKPETSTSETNKVEKDTTNKSDNTSASNKTETKTDDKSTDKKDSDKKDETKQSPEVEGLKTAKDGGNNIAYVAKDSLDENENKKVRDIEKDETIKSCSIYKMVYKKVETPTETPKPKETPKETPKSTPKKVSEVINKVMPSTGAKIVGAGLLIASVGALAGASFYIIKNRKGKTMLIALLVSGGVAYGFINNADAYTGTELAPTELIVEGQELKSKNIDGYEYVGVIEYDNQCVTIPEKPKEDPTPKPEIKGSVIVHHIWTDGTQAYPSEWVMKDQPIGTPYNTDWHHEDIGVWLKDGTRYKTVDEVPGYNKEKNENGEWTVNLVNQDFGLEGKNNFVKFNNIPTEIEVPYSNIGASNAKMENGWGVGNTAQDALNRDTIIGKLKDITSSSETIMDSKLPDVMKNKLKDVKSTGTVNLSEIKSVPSNSDFNKVFTTTGLDPINEFKYVKVADYSDPVKGEVKEKLQEITYVYDKASYKPKLNIEKIVAPTDHI